MPKPFTVVSMGREVGETPLNADVIVVGSGSAGAAAARRLVDSGDVRVLLLEAGGRDVNPAIHDPQRVHELWLADEDWAYHTVPQTSAANRRLHLPRGRVLGGSSALNGMIWVRGAPADYDHWAYLGNAGWAWEDVLPVFLRAEGSPVDPLKRYERQPIQEAIVAAAVETGIDFNEDYNGERQDGISYTQLTIRDGRRHGVSPAYLGPVLDHPNLTVITGAHARRLLLEGSRCVGVEWEREGQVEQGTADAEVIVSAGTIESPRLLMLSGIGPGDHLGELGIEVAVDLPGVGANLHDHLLSPLIFSAEREIGSPAAGLPHCQTHLFWRSASGLPTPDIQPINFSVPLYEPWMEGPPEGFSMMAGMIRPTSRGTIRLSGSDPHDELLIDLQALASEADLQRLVDAVLLCREIGGVPALQAWEAKELYPGPGVTSAAELRDYVRSTAITYHHQVGTCKMGIDADAVVDPELRVHGIDGLRVADASIMPAVTSGNTNAPSVMIGERVADFFSATHSASGTRAEVAA
jgi:choline dehydrogenase